MRQPTGERPTVTVVCEDAARAEEARRVAEAIGAVIAERSSRGGANVRAIAGGGEGGGGAALVVAFTPERVEIRDVSARARGEAAPGPVNLDRARLERIAATRPDLGQPIARALGVRTFKERLGRAPRVLDASAGLLHDTALILSLGCEVIASERHPVIGAMIEDALGRGLFAGRAFRFVRGEGPDALSAEIEMGRVPDVVYFDPMHPAREGAREATAAVRKEMVALRALVGEDGDAPATLRRLVEGLGRAPALAGAARRVVVKLPLRADALAGAPKPVSVHKAKAVRYEVYAPRAPGAPG